MLGPDGPSGATKGALLGPDGASAAEGALLGRLWREHCRQARAERAQEWQLHPTEAAAPTQVLRGVCGSRTDGFGTLTDPASGARMRFRARTVGRAPAAGHPLYICLHGGGGCPSETNDEQWAQMQDYWLPCCGAGVYIAPRGITDSWKLHWEDASFPLMDRLIENAVLFCGVDPERVYLMGYSAGGDGVWRLVPGMADRFAAGNMCAGHPNGVGIEHLQHVPMLLQVGECDDGFDRHRVTAEYHGKLVRARQTARGGGFVSACRVHCGRGHSEIADWRQRQQLVASPDRWLRGGCRPGGGGVTTEECDSVGWVSQWRRSAPSSLVWLPKTTVPRRKALPGGTTADLSKTHHWLEIRQDDEETERVEAEVDRPANKITVRSCGGWLRILLNTRLVDFSRPLTLDVQTSDGRPSCVFGGIRLRVREEVAARTLAQRGDPTLACTDEVVLRWREVERRWELQCQ